MSRSTTSPQKNRKNFLVGVDLGTTYTSVAFYIRDSTTGADHPVSAKDIITLTDYPDAPNGGSRRSITAVPSGLWYSGGNSIYWGYEVETVAHHPEKVPGIRVERYKLLLDHRDLTEEKRQELNQILTELGKTREDIIADYFTLLFNHTKSQFIAEHGYEEGDSVDLAITIPAIWNTTAEEIMKSAVRRAAAASNFGAGKDPFLVSEPAAAVIYITEKEQDLFRNVGETFVLCDAGGGTVDLTTSTSVGLDPLKTEEAVAGDGDLCGSSFLNDAYTTAMRTRLEDENYLVEHFDYDSIADVVEQGLPAFENQTKRNYKGSEGVPLYVKIHGLAKNPKKNFGKGSAMLTVPFLDSIFAPQMEKIWVLIRKQIEAAAHRGLEVTKVLFVGGFAGSPRLRNFLKDRLGGISLVTPTTPDCAIACGAILGFLNRNNRIAEIVGTNYAFKQTELYNSQDHREIPKTLKRLDKIDGKTWVYDCLHYFLRRGERIPAEGKEFRFELPLIRNINTLEHDLDISLELYSNQDDEYMKNHFPVNHPRNQNSQLQGQIEYTISSTELKSAKPKQKSGNVRGKRKRYYEVEYYPIIKIQGKNLQWGLLFQGETRKTGTFRIETAVEPVMDSSPDSDLYSTIHLAPRLPCDPSLELAQLKLT